MTATPSPNNNLNNELITQYQGLTDDVKAYFDQQQSTFLAESKSKHPDKNSFYQDRGKFIIRKKIDDLDSHRREIWSYLTSEFNRNTQDKNLNAKMMSQNKNDATRNEKELGKYQKKLEEVKGSQTTNNRLREIELYELNRRKSQIYLMKIVVFSLMLCSALTAGVDQNLLPRETIYFIFLLFCGLLCYIIYYMYLKNPGRSRRNWSKYYFDQPVEEIQKNLDVDEINYDKLDQDLDKEFHKYMDSCAAKPTDKTPKQAGLSPTT